MAKKDEYEEFIEQRKSRRFLGEFFGEIAYGGSSIRESCYIHNIGPGGGMLYAGSSLESGTGLVLTFRVGEKQFKKDAVVRNFRNFTEKRKYILQIGKSLDFNCTLNIQFNEPLDLSEIEYIRLQAQG